MRIEAFLIVNKKGSCRTTKTRPDLKWDEIAIQMNIELPDMLFKKPQLSANIIVPEKSVSQKEIDVEMTDNIKQAIETAAGMEVKITFENKES
jgi:hypothetical protein